MALLAPDTSAESPDRIRVSVSNPNMTNLSVAMAQKKGFFKDENLDAEIIRMNPSVAITALALGSDAARLNGLRNLFNADGGMLEDGLESIHDQACGSARVTHEATAREVAELTFLREAQAEFEIKVR